MAQAANAAWQPGQALFVGFEGTQCPPPLRELVAQGRVGGVILFSRNIQDATQLRGLVASLRDAAPADAPLTIAIDQEGGRVQRLRAPWTEWPPMRRVGERAQLQSTAALARALSLELRELGIGLDFAPVVDVDSNPANPIIGDRSFGRDAAVVSRHAAAFVDAMQAEGVACCAKHFPGHGDTTLDSHLALPKLAHDLDRLFEVELPPFQAAIAAGVASIMTAHVVFEAIDKTRPASFAPDVIALLRERLGYDKLVCSDDLEMKAVADHWQPREMVDAALGADVDVLLVCRRFDFVTEVLARIERVPDATIERALARVVAFKRAFPGAAPASEPQGPPYPEHEALAQRLVRGEA
ncbi:MAG: beta-N-acetylhexosaminidase [Nannocystaceae bacterium]